MTTGISKKWSKFAIGWIGTSTGRHCHWCKHIEHDDGESYCGNKKSQFSDGERIRSWDGLPCARRCKEFSLSDFYKSDDNLNNMGK